LPTSSNSPYTHAQLTFSASMQFMYRPSGAESIWVPLGGVDWTTNGQAERSQPYNTPDYGWVLQSGSSTATSNFEPVFPEWTAVYPSNGLPNCATLPTN
jgi:hypothetical protein